MVIGTYTSCGYYNGNIQVIQQLSDLTSFILFHCWQAYTESFTYDHNENRLTEDSNVGGTEVNSTYTYDSHDHLLTAGTKHYTYNADGDCTSVTNGSSVTTLKYDILNRATGITLPTGITESYTYNGNWQRVAQANGTSSSNELYEGASAGSPLIEDANATYTPGLSEERGGTDYTYHADAQGSTRGITAGGAVTDAVLYDAFGNTISRSGSTPTPVLYNGAAGYQSDSATALQLLGHRYYDPSIGRFLSSDPAQAGTNWYDYCDNNPLVFFDSSGLDITIDGPPDFVHAVQHAIKIIRKTKTGRRLLGPFGPGKNHITIKPLTPDPKEPGNPGDCYWPNTPVNKQTHLPNVPDTSPGKNVTIDLDPRYVGAPVHFDKRYKEKLPPLPIVLGHELGHANGWGDDGPWGDNNIDHNEDPLRHELGYPSRPGHYYPDPDPWKHGWQ